MTGGSSILTISIILSIPVIISGHNAFGSEYDTTLMTWKGIAGDQRIFYSVYDRGSDSWSPGAPIEGANTNLSPSLVSLPNGALLVWKGVEGDQRIFYSVYDRGSDSWSPVTNIEGANTNRLISLSSLPGGNNVLMTWKGVEGDQRIFYSVYDRGSDSWSPGAPIEGANTNLSPSLVGIAHIPTVLMTWKGVEGDQRIFYSVYDYASNSWSPVTNIEGANTNHYPTLASMVTRVLMTWKGVEGDQRIFYSVYDYASNSWSPGAPIEGANTSTDPSLTAMALSTDGSAAQILMTWKGIAGDQRIFYSVYDYASNSWSPGAPIEGANTNRITSLSYLPGGNVLMTWKGVEGDQRIFYSVYDYASNSWSPATNIEGANTSTDPSTVDTVRVTTTTTPPPTTTTTPPPTTTTTPPPTTTTTPPPTTTTTSCPNPPSGLVAWWPGDGNADDVLGDNDGVLQNGASFGSGIAGSGQAFRLDGVDDYVQIPSMNIGNTFSIDFWIYPERSAGSYEHLISNHFASSDHFGALYLHYGALQYWQNGQVLFFPPGGQTIQPNTWSHITLTYNGSDTEIYINGNKVANAAAPASGTTQHSETFNNALRIGSSDPHESSYFMGLIDDVGLYNCVLSVSEIQALSSGADKSTFTTTNGTTTTTTTTPTTTAPSIAAVTLHPDSVPQFFKCGETPYNGLPTLPGLDAETSANTAIIDGDLNTEILGRAIFDVTFSEPIRNGPGPDLVVYEMGNATEPFNVALFTGGDVLTEFIEYSAVASTTGDTDDCGFIINTAEIDLSDFGIEEETTTISGIRVDNLGAEGCCTGADISDVVILSPAATAATTSAEVAEDVPLLSEQQLQQQQQQSEGETEPATVSGGNNTEPESQTEEVAEPEPSDSGDEG